jgi:hypothetical protein
MKKYSTYMAVVSMCFIPHRGISADHGINVDQHSKPQNKGKYSILYLHLFRGFECWSTVTPW